MSKAKMPSSKPKRVIHPYICTPAYNGQTDSDFAQSLAETAFICPKFGIALTSGVLGNIGFIELMRNTYVRKFLEEPELQDCTHLFFIDADIRFHHSAFIGLLLADLPVCAGVYRRRQDPEDYPFKPSEHPDGGGLWFIDDWLQCDRVPTGFLCIRRDVLTEMVADEQVMVCVGDQPTPVPWLFNLKYEPTGQKHNGKDTLRLIGEDYSFCDKYVAKYGKKIPVWANLDFIHHGFKGNLWDWMVREKEKADAGKPSLMGLPAETSSAA